MKQDPQYRGLVDRHEQQISQSAVDTFEEPEDGIELVSEGQAQEAIKNVMKAILIIQGKLRTE